MPDQTPDNFGDYDRIYVTGISIVIPELHICVPAVPQHRLE
jgi:hypothetical protein